jgi:hypothetical protein
MKERTIRLLEMSNGFALSWGTVLNFSALLFLGLIAAALLALVPPPKKNPTASCYVKPLAAGKGPALIRKCH